MSLQIADLADAVSVTKKDLKRALPRYADIFRDVEAEMRRRIATIVREREAGEPVIPIVAYADIDHGAVSPSTIAAIKDRGCCVVRRVFDPQQMREWNDEVGRYVDDNGLTEKLSRAAEDKYFGTLASARPQIYGIYWSRPQVLARQAESLTRARIFLNRLWRSDSEGRVHFDPNDVPVYADRIRRRPPGSMSLGLSPHVDGGSIERWLDEGFRKVYRHVFSGNWRQYDPFDAAWRPDVQEVPSPAVCS